MKLARLFVVAALVASVLSAGPVGAQAQLYCEGHAATIVGTPGNDILIGAKGVDVFVALGGNDQIRGRAGDDLICAGPGDDLVWGNNGADLIYGGEGDDLIRGNRGKDVVYGGEGDDDLRGGRHDDAVRGDTDDDELRGGNGLDYLSGDLGTDALYGDKGADSLVSTAGEIADGGDGNDAVVRDGRLVEGQLSNFRVPEPQGFAATTVRAPNSVPACTQQAIFDHFAQYESSGVLELQLLALLNDTREVCGLNRLTIEPALGSWAEEWSAQLQIDRANGRTSWLRHSSTWENAVPTLGYATAGENVAWTGTQRASHLHTTLVASGSHLCNILNPNFDTVGIGATTLEADGPGIIATFMFAGDQSPETGNRFDGQPLRGLETDRTAISCNWR